MNFFSLFSCVSLRSLSPRSLVVSVSDAMVHLATQSSKRKEDETRGMVVSNEIQATVVDHVLNHGLSMREAGQKVQPNLSRFTVAAIIRIFRMENKYEIYLPCLL